ncbi:hypothetical protein [Singulisphaera sp. GP187]|uniref:hypothetical protein n=1 Tax=Singulisphaera sp. GP187 TaxID=1882752 RepID=UPI000940BAEB|nr:hypothetical protein [Singulisphaera sp. GP187]
MSEARKGRPVERRDVDLIDQVAEEGRFGQDFDIKELRCRLERDRVELLEAMQSARRVDVEDRHTEHGLPRELANPTGQTVQRGGLTPADHVVAGLDRLEQRVEMGGRPTLARRGH